MAKLSLPELESLVASLVTANKVSNASFSATRDNVVGLLDKIGKIVTLDTVFTVDKLARFDGEYLSFGKTIEDWYEDLILPTSYNASGSNAMAPNDPTYRPVYYSYTIGREMIKTTIRNNNIERAVHFEEQFISIVAMQYKRLEDSMAQYRYQLKRNMLGILCKLAEDTLAGNVGTTYATSTAYTVGTLVKNSSDVAIVVKAIANTNTDTFAQAIANGKLVKLDLVKDIAIPTDTSTGEAFLKQLKADVEVAGDISEGHSLNGNTLGVSTEGLVLLMKQGIMPSLDVDTLSGAFHLDKLASPVEIIVVKDFGDTSALTLEPYAILMDARGMRLHNTYNAVRSNENSEGDFLNVVRHTEDTPYICRNTFVRVYCKPSA